MKNIEKYYFAFNGVIIPPFIETITPVLSESNSPIPYQKLYDLLVELSLGNISGSDYFKETASMSKSGISAEKLRDLIFKEIKTSPGIEAVIKELQQKYSVYAFSQFPQDIYFPIIETLGLNKFFGEQNTIFSCQLSLQAGYKDLFKKMISLDIISTTGCLWTDADSHLTSAAIRAGIDAIIYINSYKLRREIALRGLLPLLGGE